MTKLVKFLIVKIFKGVNTVIDNYPIKSIKFLLYPLRSTIRSPILENKNTLYKYIFDKEDLNIIIKDDIYYKNTIIEKMESIKKMEINSKEYNDLYDDIISVGEFKIK